MYLCYTDSNAPLTWTLVDSNFSDDSWVGTFEDMIRVYREHNEPAGKALADFALKSSGGDAKTISNYIVYQDTNCANVSNWSAIKQERDNYLDKMMLLR